MPEKRAADQPTAPESDFAPRSSSVLARSPVLRFLFRTLVIASALALSAPATPTLLPAAGSAPTPVLLCVPVTLPVFARIAIPPALFLLFGWPLLVPSPRISKRSRTACALISVVSLVYIGLGARALLEWGLDGHSAHAFAAPIFVVGIWLVLWWAGRRPTVFSSLVFHWLFAAWLCWGAFPCLPPYA
jgi:hypothetical protein